MKHSHTSMVVVIAFLATLYSLLGLPPLGYNLSMPPARLLASPPRLPHSPTLSSRLSISSTVSAALPSGLHSPPSSSELSHHNGGLVTTATVSAAFESYDPSPASSTISNTIPNDVYATVVASADGQDGSTAFDLIDARPPLRPRSTRLPIHTRFFSLISNLYVRFKVTLVVHVRLPSIPTPRRIIRNLPATLPSTSDAVRNAVEFTWKTSQGWIRNLRDMESRRAFWRTPSVGDSEGGESHPLASTAIHRPLPYARNDLPSAPIQRSVSIQIPPAFRLQQHTPTHSTNAESQSLPVFCFVKDTGSQSPHDVASSWSSIFYASDLEDFATYVQSWVNGRALLASGPVSAGHSPGWTDRACLASLAIAGFIWLWGLLFAVLADHPMRFWVLSDKASRRARHIRRATRHRFWAVEALVRNRWTRTGRPVHLVAEVFWPVYEQDDYLKIAMPRKTILTVVGNVNDSGISLYTDNFTVLANLNLDPAAAVTEDVDLLDTCLSINLDVNLKEPQHSSPVATRTLSSSTPKASRISESVVPTSQPASIVDATNLELVRDGTPLTSAVPAVASAASKYCSLKYSQHSLPRDDADEGPRIDVAIGSTLPDTQYCVEALLGSGSYGAVYRVQDASTGIPYAAKCVEVHPAYDWNSGDDAYACYERAVHVKVQGHPNVLTLHDGFIADGSFWMILELCRGGDLRDLVSSNYFWQHPDRVKPMFLQIVDAVAHCHSKGWAHNDLKPDNILLSYEHDVAYLADFGMASESDSDTILGGTTPYIAPEFLLDTRPDEVLFKTTKNDVWAIGIILLEMVFNHRPWSEAAPTTDRKYNDYLILPSKWRRTFLRRNFPLTRDAATLIARILEPNPALRISLDELRAAIQNIESFVCAEDKLKAGSRAEQIYQRLQAGPQKEASDSFATAKAAQ